MIKLFLSVLFEILNNAEIYLFLSYLLLLKSRKNILIHLISLSTISITAVFAFIFKNIPFTNFILTIAHLLSIIICFDEPIKDKFLKYLFTYFVLNVFSSGNRLLLSMANLSDGSMENIYIILDMYSSFFFAVVIIWMIIYLRKKSFYLYLIKSIKKSVILIWTMVFGVVSFVDELYIKLKNYLPQKSATIFAVVFFEWMFLIELFFILRIVIEINRIKHIADSNEMNNYLELTCRYSNELEAEFREIRRIKHDMDAHYYAIYEYIENRDLNGATEYINILREAQTCGYKRLVSTGDCLIDSVLYGISTKFDTVRIICSGQIGNVNIRDYDLCIIFSNLVRNAMEATEKVGNQEKIVRVEIKHYQDYLLVEVRNPVESKVDICALGSFTSKIDKKCHGFGIENVRQTVELYKGSLKFDIEGDTFIARVKLSQKGMFFNENKDVPRGVALNGTLGA